MKECKTFEALEKDFQKVDSGCAGDTIFIAKALMFQIRQEQKKKRKAKANQKLTTWQKFCKDGLQKGKSLKELSHLYWQTWQTKHFFPDSLSASFYLNWRFM